MKTFYAKVVGLTYKYDETTGERITTTIRTQQVSETEFGENLSADLDTFWPCSQFHSSEVIDESQNYGKFQVPQWLWDAKSQNWNAEIPAYSFDATAFDIEEWNNKPI
jgi:hypothetical protein